MTPEEQISSLRATLHRHNYNYYVKHNPEISDFEFEPDALELICAKFNQFRQIVKFLNKAENIAEINNLKTITLPILEGILNER